MFQASVWPAEINAGAKKQWQPKLAQVRDVRRFRKTLIIGNIERELIFDTFSRQLVEGGIWKLANMQRTFINVHRVE